MANECTTIINIAGHKDGIKELAKILRDFETAPKNEGYDRALGLPECAAYGQSGASYNVDITDIHETSIDIYQNDKWSENVWRWYALAGEFGLKVYWAAFEPGVGYYATNDSEHSTFSENYVLNCYTDIADKETWGELYELMVDRDADEGYSAESEDDVIHQWSGGRFKTLGEALEAIQDIDPDANLFVNELVYAQTYELLEAKWNERGGVIRQCKPFVKGKDAIYQLRELVHSMSEDDFVGFKNLIDTQGVGKALKTYSIALQI